MFFVFIFFRQTCPLRVAKQGGRGRTSLWLAFLFGF